MRAGLLNKKIFFFQNVEVVGEYGQSTERKLVATKWANIKYEKGTNALREYVLSQSQSIVVTLRLDRKLTKDMEIELDGERYQLNAPILDRSKGEMQFVAQLILDDEA